MRNARILVTLFALFAALSLERLRGEAGKWTGGGPYGGNVIALASHPSSPSTVYAATSQRLYKSADGGVSWAPTRLFGSSYLVIPTSDASVVYAANSGPFESTFHRTMDGGQTWVDVTNAPQNLLSVAVDPNDPRTLYAVSASGLFRTTNGGDTWEYLPNFVGGVWAPAFAVDRADSRVLYAAQTSRTGAGTYRSRDRGATWQRTSLREAATRVLLFDPRHPSRLFAVTNAGLHVTTDEGESWRLLWRKPTLSRLAIDPADPDRLYMLAEGGVFVSLDGGRTVSPVPTAALDRFVGTILASGPGAVLASSERGLYRSEDSGRGWRTSNLGIREVTVRSLAIDPSDPDVVFAAGPLGIYETRNGGETWGEPIPGSPVAEVVVIDPSNRSTLYAAGGAGVHKSTDGGRTWQNSGSLTEQIAALVIDPNDSRRLLAAYRRVTVSLDGAESWRALISPEDDYSVSYYTPRLSAIAFAPSNGTTVYAAGSGDIGFVYRSDDGGNTWSDPTELKNLWVPVLAVDSCDPHALVAAGFGGLRRSVDGGRAWTASPLAEGDPSIVLVFARDPRHSSSLFAGTSSGLLWTNDRGRSWSRFEPALDEVVLSLAMDPSGRFLYAGTYSGVFRLERSFEPCRPGLDRLCLIGAKYQVSVTGRDRKGNPIEGRAIAEGDSFGYFSFPDVTGDPDFPEVFVKMVHASDQPPPYGGHDWLFHSSLTDLDYTVTVVETDTGRVRKYDARDSESLTCGRADTSAFDRDCTVAARSFAATTPPEGIGAPSGGELSLLGGRFRATVRASDPRTGRTADGTALSKGDRFGYFSLPSFTGDPSFPEIFVKMVDATAQPEGYFWVFHTGLTDLDYTLTVTDQVTGVVRTYSGGAPDGTRLCGSADTMAFRNR